MNKHEASTGKVEWYTPTWILDKVHEFYLDGIDLDPASSEQANTLVKAKKFFTEKQDGLRYPWEGDVYINPPYKRGLIERFINRAISAYRSNSAKQIIILVNNSTETKWAQRIGEVASAICLISQRVKFIDGRTMEENNSPLQGQCMYYLGENKERFKQVFSSIGVVFVK